MFREYLGLLDDLAKKFNIGPADELVLRIATDGSGEVRTKLGTVIVSFPSSDDPISAAMRHIRAGLACSKDEAIAIVDKLMGGETIISRGYFNDDMRTLKRFLESLD